MLPAVDATLHRAVEASLTAAWRGAVHSTAARLTLSSTFVPWQA